MTSNGIPLLNTMISFLVLKPLHNNPTQQHLHSKTSDLHFPWAQQVLDILITMMHPSSHCYEETSHNTSIGNGDNRSQINAPRLLNDPPFDTDLCLLHTSTVSVQSNGLVLAHLFQRSMQKMTPSNMQLLFNALWLISYNGNFQQQKCFFLCSCTSQHTSSFNMDHTYFLTPLRKFLLNNVIYLITGISDIK